MVTKAAPVEGDRHDIEQALENSEPKRRVRSASQAAKEREEKKPKPKERPKKAA